MSGQPECVVYLPRDYPSLSQTFVRNEVKGLREAGVDVEVVAVRWSLTDNIPDGWGGPHSVATSMPVRVSLRDTYYWLRRHPKRVLRLWGLALRGPRKTWWTAFRFLPTYARDVQAKNVLACHTHFAFQHMWSTLYLATLLDVPATITVHAADIYLDTGKAVRALNKFDSVVNVCDFNEQFLRGHGLAGPATHVVACGVDVPPLMDPGTPGRASQQLLSVGRLVPKKGFPGLVRAMTQLLETMPSAKLTIIGGGVEAQKELADLIAELGLADSITMLGSAPHDAVLSAISNCDVFVLNCDVPPDGNTDALPVVLREAMARAKPVVTTAVAGIPETVDHEVGWVVPPRDASALAEALRESLADPEEAERRGIQGRVRVVSRFTNEHTAQAMVEVFRSASLAHSASSGSRV